LGKKQQEKDYFQKTIQENQRNQEIARLHKEQEKQEDIKAQKAYSKMLDRQEQDRLNEI
jgi:hypothetical protein